MSRQIKTEVDTIPVLGSCNKLSAPRIETAQLIGRPTVIFSDRAHLQARYLLFRYPNKEWSGTLVYTISSGSLSDLDNLVFRVEYIFLGDVGTGGGTEFETDTDFLKLFDEFPQAEDMRFGYIHSHHNMGTGFSGTDMDEITTNSAQHLYYLSVIVSHNPKWNAKLAFRGKKSMSSEIKFNNEEDIPTSLINNIEKDVVFIADCDVTIAWNELIENRIRLIEPKSNKRLDDAYKAFEKKSHPSKQTNGKDTTNNNTTTGKTNTLAAKITRKMGEQVVRYAITGSIYGDLNSSLAEVDRNCMYKSDINTEELNEVINEILEIMLGTEPFELTEEFEEIFEKAFPDTLNISAVREIIFWSLKKGCEYIRTLYSYKLKKASNALLTALPERYQQAVEKDEEQEEITAKEWKEIQY